MALQKTYLAKNVVRLKQFRAKKSGPAIAGLAGPPPTALLLGITLGVNVVCT